MESKRLRVTNALALLLCLLCFATGVLWVSHIGIQSDEALFTSAIYPPFGPQFRLRAFHHDIPLMVMSYVGSLKSAIWAPIFFLWYPSPASLRVPSVLLAAVTVWLFYKLLLEALGPRTALAGCALLATDTMFLLTARWDWGPVVLQHLCLVLAMLLLHRFWRQPWSRWLFLGFFVLGLGLWDKAVFSWSLAGLGLAALITFPRQVFQLFTPRRFGLAILAFLVGCLPLVIYNAKYRLVTFSSNAKFSTDEFEYKLALLKGTWRGDSLFGSIMRDEWDGPVLEAQDDSQRLLFKINELGGHPRRNLLWPLLLLSLAMLPIVWRTPARKAAIFGLIFCLVTFLLMALTKGAGTGLHHSVLLWPMPHLIMASLLAAASARIRFGRPALAVLIAAACISNLLLTTTYYTNMLRNGGTSVWSDAIFPLSDALKQERPNRLCLQDWGFFDNLRMLHQGALPICVAGNPDTPEGKAYTKAQWDEPGNLFVGHTEPFTVEAESRKRYLEFMKEAGYHKEHVRIFQDSNGRPTAELYAIKKDSSH